MSKQEKDCPVEEKLCNARMLGLEEKIKSLRNAIYLSSASIIAVLTIVQLVVNILRG